MKRILILVVISLFLCSTTSAFQGGGGEATKKGSSKKKADTKKKTSGTKSANTAEDTGSARIILMATLLSRGFDFDNGSAPMCSIKGSAGSCQVQAFVFGELRQDPSAYTCSKLDRATYVGQCVGGALEGVSVVIADGTTKESREAFVSYFSKGRIAYPALTAFLDSDDLNFGVREKGSSYGCVYFGRWNRSDTNDGCRRFKTFYGNDIFYEPNARALRQGTFNLSKYSTNFSRFMSGATR